MTSTCRILSQVSYIESTCMSRIPLPEAIRAKVYEIVSWLQLCSSYQFHGVLCQDFATDLDGMARILPYSISRTHELHYHCSLV